MGSQARQSAGTQAQSFALYSAVNTSGKSGGDFDAFIFMRDAAGQGWQPSPYVSGVGNNTRFRIAPGGNNKPYEFSFLDTSNQRGVLKRLKIQWVSGPWLFRDGATDKKLEFNGSKDGVEVDNPREPARKARLYSAIPTRFITGLAQHLDKTMSFKVYAEIEVDGKTLTYGQDPEIGVDNGGDS